MTLQPRFLVVCFTLAAFGQDFSWNGKLAPGQAVEIKGVNGGVTAEPSRSGQVEVTARKTARRSNPSEVNVEVLPHEGGVTICAVYPGSSSRPNECRPGDAGRMNTRDNDVKVDFTVRVPPGVNFIGRTVNGEVRASSLEGDADARTVNGNVRIETAGFAQAKTVNGSIDASMRKTGWTRPAAFETVNGGVTVALSRTAAADFEVRTVNGSITSDLPLTLRGAIGHRRLSGSLNGGGPRLEIKTVNGSIHLKSTP